ncbi:hypothetical protein [Nevskia ramosa]|uniref:hypothetical protein n=1 Tax=Nevskia ramosa TaxID=64002 RepID=UPI0023565A1F|nr:hypothetical protein [Nevskia ramosa]
MRLTCRSCGATGSAEAVFGDVDAAAALQLAGELDPVIAKAVWHYLALHRLGTRALSWPRTEKLLREMLDLTRQPTIRRRHRDWTMTPAMWREGMEQMQAQRDKLVLPLKGHGYLLEIVADLADKTESSAEKGREQGIRSQARSTADAAPLAASVADPALVDLHGERAARQRLRMPPMTDAEEADWLAKRRNRS